MYHKMRHSYVLTLGITSLHTEQNGPIENWIKIEAAKIGIRFQYHETI